MVKGGVGVPWRTGGHFRKIQVVDRMGGDGGGNGMFLPLFVRLVNKNFGSNETKTHKKKPYSLSRVCLKKTIPRMNLFFDLTFADDIYTRPCIVDDSRNSFRIIIARILEVYLQSRSLDFYLYPEIISSLIFLFFFHQ